MTESITRMDSGTHKISAGTIQLLGASFVDHQNRLTTPDQAAGVNFAVYAPDAHALYLSLFDSENNEVRVPMHASVQGIWSLLVKDIPEGQLYGYRAEGRWAPDEGLRFNPAKLLIDPYAREVRGQVSWRPALFDYKGSQRHEWAICEEDNQLLTPRSVVRSNEFNWQDVARPVIPAEQEVIYEAHVKGLTQQHPDIPEQMRGKYLGVCHPAMIRHLKSLGVTTLELLPVTSFVSEERLAKLGLKNYWGYNPLCFMAPEPSYAIEDPVNEMKIMVRELHRAGIRVVMDVVYNHTCEAGSDGPSLNLRGLAEREYYLLDQYNGHTVCTNYSGCGNTLNFDTPQSIKLLMDSLRHWAENYRIDGFRFDLAPTMARKNRQFDSGSAFSRAVYQDPVLSRCQMIAEPWDLGPDGYRLCGFPKGWQEWNDRCRDGIRAFWRGDQDRTVDLAWRFSGSRDLFGPQRPGASINYICSHDGFTMHDLVSYNHRHNLANGEDNRDGDEHNYSCNHGEEGTTQNPEIIARREQIKRNMFTTLMLSRSTPMFLAGDEFGNTQLGNNNVYCQDNSTGWLDWSWLDDEDSQGQQLHSFVSGLTQLRRDHPVLGLRYQGEDGSFKVPGQEWFNRDGRILHDSQLSSELEQCLGIQYHCDDQQYPALMVLVNNSTTAQRFDFPDTGQENVHWIRILSTEAADHFQCEVVLNDDWYNVPAHSIVIIEQQYLS